MLITNFASGELSENLNGRVDLQMYYQGVSHLKNFSVIPTGGVKRRCGTQRMAKLSGNCRIIPFIVDKNTSFILELVPGYIYIWRNGQKVTATGGTQLSIPTSYQSIAEINEIHYAQDYNRLIFVHENYQPFMLEYKNNVFTGGNMNFDFYANVNVDDDYDYIVMAGEDLPVRVTRADDKLAFVDKDGNTIVTGEKGYCVWNGKLYEYNRDESEWEVYGEDPDIDFDLFTTENNYPSSVTFFNNRLWLSGTKNARQKVWASATPDTQGERYNDFSTYQKYVTVNKVVKDADIHIFTGNLLVSNVDVTNNTTTITDLTQDLTQDGLLSNDITDYYITNDDYIPVGTKVISVTSNSITINTALTTLTEDVTRQVFTIQLWRTVDGVSADDYELQLTVNNVTTSDCSFNFELASDQNDAIRFIAANKYLTIGTESSVWNVPSGVSALQIKAEMAGKYGSDQLQGKAVDTAMIFFAQGKYAIRETYYDNQSEAFKTNNIAIMAEQMLEESPAVDFDFVTNPYNKIVIVRDDGTVVSLLYDKTNGVMAWSRFVHGYTEARIESCAVVRGDRQSDIIYFVVNEGDDYFLEKYDENASIYLDSFSLYDPDEETDSDSITYGEEAVLYDETKDAVFNLDNTGMIEDGDIVYIGYPYDSVLSSMPLVNNDPTGKKRITNLICRFNNSYLPKVICDTTEEYFTDVEEPYSGIKSIDFAGSTDRDVRFTVVATRPKPCKILTINANLA